MCELTNGMAAERHERGMLCVNRPPLHITQHSRCTSSILSLTLRSQLPPAWPHRSLWQLGITPASATATCLRRNPGEIYRSQIHNSVCFYHHTVTSEH